MINVLMRRLPEGLKVVKTNSRAYAKEEKVWFEYNGQQIIGYLPKTCAPGMENKVADRTIFNAMIEMALSREDLDDARFWLDKVKELAKT